MTLTDHLGVSFLTDILRQLGGIGVLDGGFATELERHGADLNDPMWSSKCLVTSPHLVRKVHLDYLEAGADIIITSSYQATIQGYEKRGFSRGEGEAFLKRSVEIAQEARDIYFKKCDEGELENRNMRKIQNHRPVLIAASIGSYGAYLADGSEYSGNYGTGVTLGDLKDFHRRRLKVLAESGADIIAFETVPNMIEAQAYAELLEEEDVKVPAWISFNSKDGINVASGDPITECASVGETSRRIVAIGINCTPPQLISGLITSIKSVTTKPILIYPNRGEVYDADQKTWIENSGSTDEELAAFVKEWHKAGACLFGGCCRTTPATIRAICNALSHNIPN